MQLSHLLTAFVCCLPLSVFGQTTPLQSLPLNNLSAFSKTTPNWQVVGGISADIQEEQSISTQPGIGILANIQSEDARGHLFTEWQHADLELDLEVLMPKGSNSGIYFQSRYEIQLLDSWGVETPKHSDIGGVYQRWDENRPEGQKGYDGKPPRLNVARAPGLWQHLNILFKAPRFDGQGNKVENARFERVMLNGVVIHENVELSGPTRAAAYEDEVASAPLMIQGDHGPVAFRNIKYRQYSPASVRLSGVTLRYYEGEFNNQMPEVNELNLVLEEDVSVITSQDAQAERQFVLQYNGLLDAPVSGTYLFEVSHTSRVRLTIEGQEVLTDQSERVNGLREFPRNAGTIELEKGEHVFELAYAKGRWHGAPTALGFFSSGPDLMRTELTESGSLPHDAYSAYEVKPVQEPWLQRNFVPHKGEKRTHAISVGYPSGINYSYDMARGALLHIWKGPFVDASSMWYQRGNMQSALPLGSVIERSGLPVLASLDSESAAWPDSLDNYELLRYEINGEGEPTFFYKSGSLDVADSFTLEASQKGLTRNIYIEGQAANVWVLLAESESVEEQQPGLFIIDDQRLYVKVNDSQAVQIRDVANGKQLVMPVPLGTGKANVEYSFIW